MDKAMHYSQRTDPYLSTLTPFRRRIRLLRAWRLAAFGGALGALGSVALILLDYESLVSVPRAWFVAPALAGIAAGLLRALFEPLTASQIARSVDKRGSLADRLTSAAEVGDDTNPMGTALKGDAVGKAQALDPRTLYPLRLGRPQAILLAALIIAAVIYLAANTTLFLSKQGKIDAIKSQQAAAGLEHVAKPFLAQADEPGASPQEKNLARDLRRFDQDLKHDRLTRQQALLTANKLSERADQLEQPHAAALAQSTSLAQTAADKLNQMASNAALPKSPEAMEAQKAQSLAQQIASLQQQLAANHAPGSKSNLTAAQRAALQSKLAAAQHALQQIQLSLQAQRFLQRLMAEPDYQEAQRLLAKLNQQASAEQSGEQTPLTPEQLKAAADRIEQLAKEFSSDAQLKELARQMLEAAKHARAGRCVGVGAGIKMACGLAGRGGFSSEHMDNSGPGAPSEDVWTGAAGHLARSDKSSLLKVKFQDRQITSQIGSHGPSTYTEYMGPAQMGDKSSVPYEAVLPTYRKMAESALAKNDIPARERTRVKDYFDSLRK
ncbi:MAG TPA: hypothetical protein VFW40_05210 [Capsulimonadaceae bacterium]|nr:hypothetical protein [Capsulimonadaceae bacterium]